MFCCRELLFSKPRMKNPFTHDNSYIAKRSRASRCNAPKRFSANSCRFFRGRRQGRQPLNNSLHEIHKNLYLRFRTWESQTMTEMFIRLFIFHVIRLHQTLPNISIYFPASWITWKTFPHPFHYNRSSALTYRGHGHLSPLDTQGSWVRQHLHLVMIGHNR